MGSAVGGIGDEQLHRATPSRELLGTLERPEYSILRIFALGHLLMLDGIGVERILNRAQNMKLNLRSGPGRKRRRTRRGQMVRYKIIR